MDIKRICEGLAFNCVEHKVTSCVVGFAGDGCPFSGKCSEVTAEDWLRVISRADYPPLQEARRCATCEFYRGNNQCAGRDKRVDPHGHVCELWKRERRYASQ